MTASVTLQGMDDYEKQIERIERGFKALAGYRAAVGSRMPYAYGIEMGQHRVSGKTARRAGGVHYLQRGVDEVMSNADLDITQGMNKVTAPGPWILRRLAKWARRLARANVPRERGKLRRSIRAEVWRA